MAEITEERIAQKIEELKAAFADGFQLHDLHVVLRAAVEFSSVAEIPAAEQRALAVKLLERVIDETDTPWLPDSLVDPLSKKLVPGLVDVVFDALQGKLAK